MAAILPPVRKLPFAEAPFYCVVILTNESEKRSFYKRLYRLTKKGKNAHIWKCHVTMTRKEVFPYKEVSRDTDEYKSSDL